MSLRRTGFKRPTLERPPRPLVKPVTDCRGTYARASNEPVVVEKETIHRSEPYRRWVAEQECFICGVRGWSQAAHENVGKAMQRKVCDSRIFPACGPRYGLLGCHQQFDIGLEYTRDERRALGAELVARMQARAVADGWRFEQEGIRRV